MESIKRKFYSFGCVNNFACRRITRREDLAELLPRFYIKMFIARSSIKLFTLKFPREQSLPCFLFFFFPSPVFIGFRAEISCSFIIHSFNWISWNRNDAFIAVSLKYYQGIKDKSSRRVKKSAVQVFF
jgi:hypothetical protein